MTDPLEQQIIAIIENILGDKGDGQPVSLTTADSMETVAAWDSMSFMSVFLAINEAFDVNPDFDDAIHYTSVSNLHTYLKEQASR